MEEQVEADGKGGECEHACLHIHSILYFSQGSLRKSEKAVNKTISVFPLADGIVIPIVSEAVNRAGSWCFYIHLHGIFILLYH